MRHAAPVLFVLSFLLPRQSLALEANEVFKAADPSVVVVLSEMAKRADDMFGSGVIVGALDVVTSCHVVKNALKITVKQGSVQRSAILRYQDAARDLCQIRLDDSFPSGRPVAAMVASKDLEVGQSVFAIGSPRGLEHTISRGIVSALREMKEEAGTLVQTDAAVSPGSSGGGLFDTQARLIGIMTFQFREGQNLNFAVPAEWVQEIAKRNRERLADAPPTADKSVTAPIIVQGVIPVGSQWKYRVLDGKREVGNLVIEVVDTHGKFLKERITRDDERSFLAERNVDLDSSAARYQEVVFLPGGYQLAEFAPYVRGGEEIRAGQRWQELPLTLLLGGYGYGKQKFAMTARVVGREKILVPAGVFDAVHVQATSQKNLGSDLVRIICDYWYSPDSMRAVKMKLEMKYSNPSFQPNAEIYELVTFTSAK